MTAQCPYCGTAAKPNSAYCVNCGQLLAAAPAEPRTGAAAFPPPIGGASAPGGVPILPPLPPLGPRPPVPLPAPLGADSPSAPPPRIPAAPAPVETPAPVARPAVVVLPDGSTRELAGQLVLGRNPAAAGGVEGHTLIALDDPRKTISRAHLAIDARGARVTAVDLASGNGTTLVRGGSATRLSPRLPVILEPGDRLLLGMLEIGVD